ncbi:MAG: bifunctional glutamine synthetase adenylyltransferase/deadenyltransferase, partial [Alphaproteobacteria bacterium]|nr:bifunctional glutamine synthetase adenylyltransferase/deadenyltransferase [Alphaproteobacteria bacterium]
MTTSPEHAAAWAASVRHSRYARRLLERTPGLATTLEVAAPFTAATMTAALTQAGPADEAALARALRELRGRVMLTVLARDLGGLADLAEVTGTMSALADTTVGFATEQLEGWMQAQYGVPRSADDGKPQGLMVVGMGKLGGRELNVSSDIDLVFLFPDDGETDGARSISNFEYFTRLARRLIGVLNEITEDGYVFRVDMRLRPYGESGPLVCSLAMLE